MFDQGTQHLKTLRQEYDYFNQSGVLGPGHVDVMSGTKKSYSKFA